MAKQRVEGSGAGCGVFVALAFLPPDRPKRFAGQFGGDAHVNHALGFVACLTVTFDQHLYVTGNRPMLKRGNALHAVPRGRIEANRDACTRWGFCFARSNQLASQ